MVLIATTAYMLTLLIRILGLIRPPDDILAFESTQNDNADIYLLDLNTLLTINLTRHPAQDRAPSWSPDGQQIAFYSDRERPPAADIYFLDIATGTTQRITHTGRNNWQPRWSPDGSSLLYIRNFNEITVMAADEANRRFLAYGFGPNWSADGRQIVFYHNPPNTLNSDIFTVHIDDAIIQNVTYGGAHDWSPAWSPDNQHVAFVSSGVGQAALYIIRHSSGPCHLPLSAPPLCEDRITRYDIAANAPAWSPDGQRIAFSMPNAGRSQLFVLDFKNSQLRQLTFYGENTNPAWLSGSATIR
jgi:TolB protein